MIEFLDGKMHIWDNEVGVCPPSRFVRIALFKDLVEQPKIATKGINSSFHLLNTVAIPFGDVREGEKGNTFDYTQWAVVKDLTHKKLDYRTYDNLNSRSVQLPTG